MAGRRSDEANVKRGAREGVALAANRPNATAPSPRAREEGTLGGRAKSAA
jgi:hypothetical protein